MMVVNQFYMAIAVGDALAAAQTLGVQGSLTGIVSERLHPFGEALKFSSYDEGNEFLNNLSPTMTSSDRLASIIAPLRPDSLAQATLFLRRSRDATRTLFSSSDEILAEVRNAIGPMPPTKRPEKFRNFPAYFNTRIRHDLNCLRRQDGSYIDLSSRPVLLHQLVHDGFLDVATLLDAAPNPGQCYQLLYALSEEGEVRVGIRARGIFHSSFFGPTVDVLAAGNIYVRDGNIIQADLASGHFAPDHPKSLKLFRRVLMEVDIPGSREMILDFVGLSPDETEEEKIATGLTFMDRGNERMEDGDYEKAAALFFIAGKAFQLEGDKKGLARALWLEGWTLYETFLEAAGNNLELLQKLESIFERAAEAASLSKDHALEMKILEKLADVLRREGATLSDKDQWLEAADQYQNAQEVLARLSALHEQAGEDEKVKALLVEQGKMVSNAARFLLNSADLRADRPPRVIHHDTIQSEIDLCRKALRLVEKVIWFFKDSEYIASSYVNQGKILMQIALLLTLLGKEGEAEETRTEARPSFQKALEIVESLGDKYSAAKIRKFLTDEFGE